MFERCCLRQGVELAEGLEAELHALRERLRGIRLLMDTPCYELCDGWRLRREAQDFRDCEAISSDPLFLVDADAGDDEVEVRVVQSCD